MWRRWTGGPPQLTIDNCRSFKYRRQAKSGVFRGSPSWFLVGGVASSVERVGQTARALVAKEKRKRNDKTRHAGVDGRLIGSWNAAAAAGCSETGRRVEVS